MLPPLRFYSSVSNVDASPDALASGFELFACSTFLLERFAFDHACPYVPIGAFHVRSRLSLRSYWSVSRSITPVPTFLLERFTFDHACCLTHSAKQNGLRNVSFLFRRGSGSPIVRSQRPCDYRTQLVHFGIVRFLAAIPTENEETRERGRPENRIGGAAQERFCVIISALPCFPRGVRWGLRAPKPAPKSHWLSGLSSFDSPRGCVLRSEGDSGITEI